MIVGDAIAGSGMEMVQMSEPLWDDDYIEYVANDIAAADDAVGVATAAADMLRQQRSDAWRRIAELEAQLAAAQEETWGSYWRGWQDASEWQPVDTVQVADLYYEDGYLEMSTEQLHLPAWLRLFRRNGSDA